MMPTVEQLQASLRLDEVSDDEKTLMAGYLAAAEDFVAGAIGCDKDFLDKNSSLSDVVILAVAGGYWQNPVAVTAGSNIVEVDLVYKSIIAKLRARWGVSPDGTTSESGTTGA